MRPTVPSEWSVYCQDPPVIKFGADGMVHLEFDFSGFIFRAVMRPVTFTESVKRAHRVSDEIAGHVPVPLRPKRTRGK